MATLVATKINEIMKLMRKYSIGAFPNNMTMFKLSNGVVAMVDDGVRCQMINQEDENNQTLMNFSKYFDVLLMMMKSRNVMHVTIDDDSQQQAAADMNIPLLKQKFFAGPRCPLIIDDGAVARRVTYDDNNDKIIYLMMIKQNMMAILNIVHNSNNKKLTNNCKIEINTENINFSYYCDEYYEIILDVSVFLSQKVKVDIMREINGSIIMMMAKNSEKLQSHIQSFIVTISSQSNTNKSEYAFEKTLNNDYDDKFYYVAINDCSDKRVISIKSMMVMPMQLESTSKLYFFLSPSTPSHQQFFSFFMQLYPRMITMNYDDSDASYLMMLISLCEMQLNCQKSLQSLKESDQQSGIVVVSINSCNNIKLMIHGATNNKQQSNILMTAAAAKSTTTATTTNDGDMEHVVSADDRMNISELLFSHINDKNETLIDNTVNITCDFNYLNYKINNDKINDQIQSKDNVNVKDTTTLCNNNNMENYKKSSEDFAPCVKRTVIDDNNDLSGGAADRTTANSFTQIDMLIECQRRENALMKQFEASGRRLRLCGGGGDSLSGGGASGWGSPPSQPGASNSNPNANAAQWGASAQQTPQQNWGNQAAQQAVGGPAAVQQQSQQAQQNAAVGQAPQGGAQGQKPLTPSGGGGWNQPPQNPNQAPPQQVVGANATGIVGGGTSTVAAKNQLEQLNSMREALFAQDGWSCQNVNQDTNWDVPGSPEPGPRGEGANAGVTQWKSHQINNGTELWEANLRNGGQPPPQPVQKTPWNHTPTTNIGGTWGEEDEENSESTNVWTSNQNTQQPAPGWNQGGNSAGAANVWPQTQGGVGGVNANIPKKDDWGSNVTSNAASNWDPRGPSSTAGGPMDIRGIDPRDPRAAGGNVDMRMIDAREQMQGNLRGVTGRLNGPDMWQQHAGIQGMPGMNKIVGPNAAAGGTANNPQWPGSQVGGPKDIDMNKTSGWDSSPPAARRPIDDGTSLWGQNRVPGGIPGGDTSWKGAQNQNQPFNRNPIGPAAPTGMPPSRLPNASIKPEGNTWGIHPGGGGGGGNRNTWEENVHNQNWDDKSHLGGGGGIGTPWNSEAQNAGPLWNKNKPSWPDNDITNDWPNQNNKLSNTSSEIIRSSKPFRILAESGFKKDDVELALRNTNMNLDEAMELLQQQQRNLNIEPWHQQQSQGGFDHSPFPGNRYPGPQMFPPNNPNKMPNANAGGPGANMGLNNIPMPFNKHLPHQAGAPAFPQSAAASQSGQPSAHHLRNLVQQIQKAVQAGYLNHQILNQPLAPQTLQLLNSLLNAIQQLQSTQQSIQRNGGVNSIQLQMTIQNQKKQISALQTQISQQQALYIKSQVGGGGGNGGGGIGSGDFLRQNSASGMGMGVGNHNDPIASLENNLSNLGLKNEPSPYTSNTTSQQSRLNQWKLPSAIDNKSNDPDFSRAPGTTSSKQSLPPTTPTSISAIGIHNEPSTWSSGRNDGGWPDSNIDTENKDWPSSNQSPAFTDLVPEFQPGKPWKGNQKNIEDDPSITPGSVARNPLSISAAKESELFGTNAAKTSPNEILSSSTWSFNPSTSTQQNFNSTMPKLGADTKTNSWSDSTSDLWAAPTSLGKSAGPPPGLGASKNGSSVATSETNDWMNWNSSNTSGNSNGTWYSTWLLLKNLTTQIDGSTLRTLCVQHGPLQHFHLYLNHGIALCKYNSREEASKAQQALNNCVLGNTTICAESPSESEVQNILSHLGVPAGGNGGNGNGSAGSVSAGPSASTWRPPSQQSGPRAGSDSATWGSDWPPSNSAINW